MKPSYGTPLTSQSLEDHQVLLYNFIIKGQNIKVSDFMYKAVESQGDFEVIRIGKNNNGIGVIEYLTSNLATVKAVYEGIVYETTTVPCHKI
jgi:hypothetical protein